MEFPYIEESCSNTQLVMCTVVMRYLPYVSGNNFDLKNKLNDTGYKNFIYHEGYNIHTYDGEVERIDIISLIVGRFEDIIKIQFHLIPEVSEVDSGPIDRVYHIDEMNEFIKIAINMMDRGIQLDSTYFTSQIREGLRVVLNQDKTTYNMNLVQANKKLTRAKKKNRPSIVESCEKYITIVKSKLEELDIQLSELNSVDEKSKKLRELM